MLYWSGIIQTSFSYMKPTTEAKIIYLKTHSQEIMESVMPFDVKHKKLNELRPIYSYFLIPEIHGVSEEEQNNPKFKLVADIFSTTDSSLYIFEEWFKSNMKFYDIL